MNPNSNPIRHRTRRGEIAPIDLALVAMRLADGSGMHASQKFQPAFDLLAGAAEFLKRDPRPSRSNEDMVKEAYADSDQRWTFVQATAVGGPLNDLWKSRQGLEKEIKKWERLEYVEKRFTERWLKERSLSALDISTIRSVKKYGPTTEVALRRRMLRILNNRASRLIARSK